jgi:hypothetical protein
MIKMLNCKLLSAFVGATLLAVVAPLSAATLADIHREKLPQDVAVQGALDSILPLEELVDHWSGTWNASIPKDQAQTTLNLGLSTLQRSAKEDPKNEELELTIALLAHYAYNVDVDGVESQFDHALDTARSLAPADYRPAWFQAYHQCQDMQAIEGMKSLEAIETTMPWQQFPIEFWDDYIACSIVTNVPSHGLRAYDRMKQIYPTEAFKRDNYRDILLGRSVASNVANHYTNKQVWMVDSTKTSSAFTSFACGMSFSVRPEAPIQLADIDNGVCGGFTNIGPYGKEDKSNEPSIFYVSRPPKDGETLEDFKDKFTVDSELKDATPAVCPVEHCLALENAHGKNIYAQMIMFERDYPEYPGLILERPYLPAPDDSAKGFVYYHPDERVTRFSGKRYFMVGVTSPTGSQDKAKADYVVFVKALLTE